MLLIAEAGVNHNGKLDMAYRLATAAKESGADVVKFQFFSSKKLWGDDRLKHLELRLAEFNKLHAHCENIGIEFCCSPFGVEELLLLQPLLKRVKVASGMKNRPFLEAVRDTGLPVLFSTGMSNEDEVANAMDLFDNVIPLQCTSAYPCRLEDVNLKVLDWMMDNFGCCGLSDHTTGITVPIAATALGATVIEKHFTLDRSQEGPDHKASITPKEFRAMKMAIIEVEAAMGDPIKRVLPSEEVLRKAWKK